MAIAVEREFPGGDERLLGLAASGDRDALDRLVAEHRDRIYAVVRGIVLDDDEADDVVQDVLAHLPRQIGKFDGRAKFSTWVYRIAVNRAVSHLRAARFRFRPVPIEKVEIVAPETPSVDPTVSAALARLNPQDRAAITLYYWEELPMDEIAATLGIGVSAAKMRLHRARERFRDAYEELDR